MLEWVSTDASLMTYRCKVCDVLSSYVSFTSMGTFTTTGTSPFVGSYTITYDED